MGEVRRSDVTLRSFGYGVMSAEVPPNPNPPRNGEAKGRAGELIRKVQGLGLQGVEEVIPDPAMDGRVFILLNEGQEPVPAQVGLLAEVWDDLRAAVDASLSDRFARRLTLFNL